MKKLGKGTEEDQNYVAQPPPLQQRFATGRSAASDDRKQTFEPEQKPQSRVVRAIVAIDDRLSAFYDKNLVGSDDGTGRIRYRGLYRNPIFRNTIKFAMRFAFSDLAALRETLAPRKNDRQSEVAAPPQAKKQRSFDNHRVSHADRGLGPYDQHLPKKQEGRSERGPIIRAAKRALKAFGPLISLWQMSEGVPPDMSWTHEDDRSTRKKLNGKHTLNNSQMQSSQQPPGVAAKPRPRVSPPDAMREQTVPPDRASLSSSGGPKIDLKPRARPSVHELYPERPPRRSSLGR